MQLNKFSPNQIITVGATQVNVAKTPLSSKASYMCANADITRGYTLAPTSLKACLDSYPQIKEIALELGVTSGNQWFGPTGITGASGAQGNTQYGSYDLLLGIKSQECEKINSVNYGLGTAWLGCLWGSPMASFSCRCPEINNKFLDYIKLRLNVATFWNTPIYAPAQRQEFTDCLENNERVEILVAGNFDLRPGLIVEIRANNMSGYAASSNECILSKKYTILSVKHTITNSGVHQTYLVLSEIRKNEIQLPAN